MATGKQYQARRKNSVRKHKLSDSASAELIMRLLRLYWPPEEISNRLSYENNPISISTCTIYRGLQNGLFDPSLRKVLRIKGKQRCGGHKKSKCGHLDIGYTIHDRPKKVKDHLTVDVPVNALAGNPQKKSFSKNPCTSLDNSRRKVS